MNSTISGWPTDASRVAKTSSKDLEDMTLSLSISTLLTVMFSLRYPTCTYYYCEDGIVRRLKSVILISYFALASGSTGAGMINCFEIPRFLLVDGIEDMRQSDQATFTITISELVWSMNLAPTFLTASRLYC